MSHRRHKDTLQATDRMEERLKEFLRISLRWRHIQPLHLNTELKDECDSNTWKALRTNLASLRSYLNSVPLLPIMILLVTKNILALRFSLSATKRKNDILSKGTIIISHFKMRGCLFGPWDPEIQTLICG